MKRLLVFVVAAMALAGAQDASARAVRVREGAPGQGLKLNVKGVARGKAAASARSVASVSAEDAAVALGGALGLAISSDELRVRRDDTDMLGRRHVRLRQVYRGLEVDGRELIVHFGTDGRVYEVNGEWLDGLSLGTTPAIVVEGAELVVFCNGDDAAAARLAWRKRSGRHYVFTDAETGERLHTRRAVPSRTKDPDEDVEDDEDPIDAGALILRASTMAFPDGTDTTITGSLPVQHGGGEVTVGAIASADGNTYLTTKSEEGIEIGVLDGFAAPKYRFGAAEAVESGDKSWFDYFVKDTYWTAYSDDEDEDMPNALAIVHNISLVLGYYMDAFNRLSYDGLGGRVAAWRFWQDDEDNLLDSYANACWTSIDGQANTNGCFFFGYDLKGRRSETSFDTCAHELTHGVTSWSADLIYEGEPGALNESFSDVIAAGAEFAVQPRAEDLENPGPSEADWLFDEDAGFPMRSYAQPQLYNQPSRYKGRQWCDTSVVSEYTDNGGVHINSGVQNHFFYLLSEGGKGNNDGIKYDLKGIGVDKAAKIAYLALTAYCGPRTDYAAVVGCWDSAARDLVESGVITEDDYAALEPAWRAVMSDLPQDSSCGEIIYAGDDGLFVRAGAPNTRNRSRVAAVIPSEQHGTVRLSGYAQDGVAVLKRRGGDVFNVVLGLSFATISTETVTQNVTRASPLVDEVEGLDGLRVGVAFEGEMSLDDTVEVQSVRWGGKKLPLGVRVAGKTGKLTGVPKKAGSGTATVEARCKFTVAGQERPVTAKVARRVEWTVAALDDWAVGKFTGDGVQITISKFGSVRGYVVVNGKKVRISAKSYSLSENGESGEYTATGKCRGGTFSIRVTKGGLTGTLQQDSTIHFSASK